MRVRAAVLGAVFAGVAAVGVAQGPNAYGPPVGPPPPPVPINALVAQLADQPGSHTGFVFDKNMLGLAQSVLQSGGMDASGAAAA